jgi:hypothetical protein
LTPAHEIAPPKSQKNKKETRSKLENGNLKSKYNCVCRSNGDECIYIHTSVERDEEKKKEKSPDYWNKATKVSSLRERERFRKSGEGGGKFLVGVLWSRRRGANEASCGDQELWWVVEERSKRSFVQ